MRYAIMGLVVLLASCATAPVALREPTLPDCLIEDTRAEGKLTGRFEFAPSYIGTFQAFMLEPNAETAKTLIAESIRCASDTARTLRESIEAIRSVNAERK